ncbi:methyltransferase domain-containing protein [Legionella sp. D16C41]|uniref:methyltransferase domain-containing protein n=1 Tax=Legionella sp. D16C41 TaxID=3402688 RepID=UPI003AF59FAD
MEKVLSHKKKLIAELGNISDTKILDYGCGRGDFIELLLLESNRPKKIFAVDSNKETIKKIQTDFSKYVADGILVTEVCTSPAELQGNSFDKIICHNVLECVSDKLEFINNCFTLLKPHGILLLSHHDFDSAIYNSQYKELTRDLIHYFADTQQSWQENCDGQMGRKIPGLMAASFFNKQFNCKTWRIVERSFQADCYGFLMANMLIDIGKGVFDPQLLHAWINDLELKSQARDYYFAIDLVLAICERKI